MSALLAGLRSPVDAVKNDDKKDEYNQDRDANGIAPS